VRILLELYSSTNNLIKVSILLIFLFLLGRAFFILFLTISGNKELADEQIIFFTNVKLIYPILGIAALGNFLFILNFFIPLKSPVVYIYLGLLMLFNFKQKLRNIKNFISKFFILSYLYLIILLVSSTDISFHYDAGYYHLNNQFWISDSKLILGFVNIFWPLGIGSIFEYISAFLLFDTSFISLHLINVIFVWFFYSYFQYQILKKTPLYYPSIFLILFSFLDNFGFNGGRNGFIYFQGIGAQDIAVAILFLLISLNIVYKIKLNEFNKTEIFILFFFALFTFQIKVSGATVAFLLVWYIFKGISQKKIRILEFFKVLVLPIFLFFLWNIKTFLQTGCFIFPLDTTCINPFNWYIHGSTKIFEEVSRSSSYAYSFGESFLDWGSNLFNDELRVVITYNFLLSLIFLLIIKKVFFVEIKERNYKLKIYNIFILFSLLFLMITGPIPRYLIGTILLLVATRASSILKLKYDFKYITHAATAICIISVIMFPRYSSYTKFDKYFYPSLNIPVINYTLQPNGWLKPTIGDQCWNNLNCTMEKGNINIKYENTYKVIYKAVK